MSLPGTLSVAVLSLSMSLAPAGAAAQQPAASKSKSDKPAAVQQTAPVKPKTDKPAATAPAGGVRTVEITGGDDMKYSLTTIDAKPGEQLRIRLVSKGTLPKVAMAHNVVVLKPSASQIKFATAAAAAATTGYVPQDMKDQVIAASDLAGPGETVEVTFKVPAASGSYPYICTFPGHFAAGMRGNIVVK